MIGSKPNSSWNFWQQMCLPLKVFGMQRGKFRELEITCNTALDIQTSHYCRWFPGSIKKQEGARAISEQS